MIRQTPEAFVRLFQRRAGLAVDGIAGPATIGKLDELLPPTRRQLADPAAFFAATGKITGRLIQVQVDTINRLLEGAAHWPVGWMAYGLATAWHEAGLKPIREIGRGRGRRYGKPGARSDGTIGPTYGGQIPYGRGLVQLTWVDNYEWADKALGLDGSLLADFDRALEPDIAARILVLGMERGSFTGKSLADYITGRGSHAEFVSARRVINGTDRAALIAAYAEGFQAALDAGKSYNTL